MHLTELGHDVLAIDLASSEYAEDRVFPVVDYDGRTFPVPDHSIDCVLSSNVLEHVEDLPQFHREVRRVLRPGGICVHDMPTSTWRLWSTLVVPPDFIVRMAPTLRRFRPWPPTADTLRRMKGAAGHVKREAKWHATPRRHGSRGNLLTEQWYFSIPVWKRHFRRSGYELVEVKPMGLLYTGNFLFGTRLSIPTRRRLAKVLGSSCALYVVRPH
jgi:SAM-dependent methyltransferase